MPSKLRQSSARVSFFSFLDMITTTTGVLIIVMLAFSLQGIHRVEGAAAPAQSALQLEVERARKELAAKLEALHQRQADASALAHRVFVLPKPDPSGKQPVLIVLSATNGLLMRLGQTNAFTFKPVPGRDGFERALASCDASRDRLVFYVRPSGIALFHACHDLAQRRSFTTGSDAAEEDREYLLTR